MDTRVLTLRSRGGSLEIGASTSGPPTWVRLTSAAGAAGARPLTGDSSSIARGRLSLRGARGSTSRVYSAMVRLCPTQRGAGL